MPPKFVTDLRFNLKFSEKKIFISDPLSPHHFFLKSKKILFRFQNCTKKNMGHDCKDRKITCCRRGPKGDKGCVGEKGPVGPKGPEGPTGAIGIQGPTGVQGVRGPTGSQGSQGVRGPTGSVGMKGQKGDKCTGPTGVQGIDGPTGPVGPMGQSFCDCGNWVKNNFKENVIPVGARVHLELEKECFRLVGRVPSPPLCTELCTLPGTTVKVVVPIPDEALDSSELDKDCSIGIWTACARKYNGSGDKGDRQLHCGISNSGDMRIESWTPYPQDHCAVVELCIVHNFDERLFQIVDGVVEGVNSEYCFDLLQFVIHGKFVTGLSHECPVPEGH
jgi:hypothetical protein